MAGQTPLLTLETLTERPTIMIDGQHFRLHTVDSLPLGVSKTLQRAGDRFDVLYNASERSPAEDAELSALTQALACDLVEAPPAILAALTDRQRVAIILTFQLLPTSQAALRAMGSTMRHRAPRSTGARRSRASRRPTRAPSRRLRRG